MPPTGKMTEELAVRRVKRAVKARTTWNITDIQFFKQQGRLDELCENINCDQFTEKARRVPECEVQIPIDAVASGLAKARPTHAAEGSDDSGHDCSDNHSDGGPDDQIIEVSKTPSLSHKRKKKDSTLTSSKEDEPTRKKTTTFLPKESRLKQKLQPWEPPKPEDEVPQVRDVREDEIPVGQFKHDPVPKRIVVADITSGILVYRIRNWTVKAEILSCGDGYDESYPSDKAYSWDWDVANRNIVWLDHVKSVTRTFNDFFVFLIDETNKNAKSSAKIPYRNGDDFRAHRWLYDIWNITMPGQTAESLSDPERTTVELLSMLKDFDEQSRLMYRVVGKVHDRIEKCSQDESTTLPELAKTTEQGLVYLWEQMHAMVHTLYATRKQPKLSFRTRLKLGDRALSLFGMRLTGEGSEKTIVALPDPPKLKAIYHDEEVRHSEQSMHRDAECSMARKAKQAQQGGQG